MKELQGNNKSSSFECERIWAVLSRKTIRDARVDVAWSLVLIVFSPHRSMLSDQMGDRQTNLVACFLCRFFDPVKKARRRDPS